MKGTWMSGQVEIVFNFDTTGSMYSILGSVRRQIDRTVRDLLLEIPNLRVGIGANGDYGDLYQSAGYDTTHLDLTQNVSLLTNFVNNVKPTYGFGNGGECYELALHRARTAYSWTPEAKKVLVMIGDEIAHKPTWHENKQRLDWREEAQALADQGIHVYSVQCLSRYGAMDFWAGMADIGGGYYLQLDQFTEIMPLISAIIYRQDSDEKLEAYEKKVTSSGASRTLTTAVSVLRGQPRDSRGRFVRTVTVTADDGQKLIPVSPGRFQMMEVDEDTVIKNFVEENSLAFTPGRGFYEFTKRETIQDKKEIVIRDRSTGDMFSGKAARDLLGIPMGMGRSKISPKHGDKYDVFVQSTSYNRKLIGGSKFLYEVNLAV